MSEVTKSELPLSIWYPANTEPEIGEPILFVSRNWIKYYTELSVKTGVTLDMPNEVVMGTYVGAGRAEVSPVMPPVSVGVWTPLPLFFFESSIRSLMKVPKAHKRMKPKQSKDTK